MLILNCCNDSWTTQLIFAAANLAVMKLSLFVTTKILMTTPSTIQDCLDGRCSRCNNWILSLAVEPPWICRSTQVALSVLSSATCRQGECVPLRCMSACQDRWPTWLWSVSSKVGRSFNPLETSRLWPHWSMICQDFRKKWKGFWILCLDLHWTGVRLSRCHIHCPQDQF